MLHKVMPSIDAMIQLASLSLILMICVGGCSGPESQTLIIVQLPTDRRESKQVSVDDVLLVAGETAAQFGLSGTQGSFFGDEHPRIWMIVYPDDFPLVVDIMERYIEHRTAKHRHLADTLVTNLNKLGLNASVTFHTPDPVVRGRLFYVFIYAGLGAVAAWLLWRRSVRVGKLRARFEAAHRSLVLAIDTQKTERRSCD